MCWVVTTSEESKTICNGTANQKNKRDLVSVRIGGIQKAQIIRKWDFRSPHKSLQRQRINQELIEVAPATLLPSHCVYLSLGGLTWC